MSTPWRAAVAGLDAATAACAALNLTYFLYRLASRRDQQASRRVAAAALALVSLGALAESLFFLASLAATPADSPLASLPWALARALPFIGAAFISVLVLRRISRS